MTLVDAGAGADTINVVTGTDTLTGGAGADTYDFANTGTDAVVQVSTVAAGALDTGIDVDRFITVNIDGYEYLEAFSANHDTMLTNFVTNHAANVLADTGVTVTRTANSGSTSDDDLVFTGAADGTAFVINGTTNDGGAIGALAVTATTAATKLVTQATSITDFAAGDILDFADVMTEAGAVYYEGAAASSAAADNIYVLTDTAGFANAEAAEDAVVAGTISTDTADGIFVFLNSSLGYAQVVRDGDIDTDAADLGGNTGAHVLANLTNITSAEQLAAAFTTDSIVI